MPKLKNSLIQLKQDELKTLKEKWHKEQRSICPILKKEFPLVDMVMDHQHKLKAEDSDSSGKGLCRGAIQRSANVVEGKLISAFKRYGLEQHIDLILFLRNLADYLEENRIHQTPQYIHPSEKKRVPILSKVSYNRLVSKVNSKQKIPGYNKKLTKTLEILFKKYNIEPELR